MSAIEIRMVSAASAEAAALIARLDRDILDRYPGDPVNGIDAADFEAEGGVFVIAEANGRPAGCGAFRPVEPGVVEIKRMFVADDFRGRGVARRVLAFLEAEAVRRGFTRGILETGTRQPEAIALYRAAGWHRIEPYGDYADSPQSLCFGKSFALAGAGA